MTQVDPKILVNFTEAHPLVSWGIGGLIATGFAAGFTAFVAYFTYKYQMSRPADTY